MDMTTAKPFLCKSDGCGMSFTNEDHLTVHEKKHEMMLNLSLSGQKYGNIFVADQTPTPTRLIKNCEEVGLFDDLRHVNPFDETFRRAVEQKSGQTPCSQTDSLVDVERDPAEDSLHTPQVFPQIDVNDNIEFRRCESLQKSLDVAVVEPSCELNITDAAGSASDLGRTEISRQNESVNCGYGKIQRYRSIAEKPADNLECVGQRPANVQLPVSIQLIQPQLITFTFANNNNNNVTCNRGSSSSAATLIPVQTVKPFILPKLATSTSTTALNTSSITSMATTAVTTTASAAIQPEPSSASLTPTSQLPIKERLKVILSNSSKSRIIELPQKNNGRRACKGASATNSAPKCVDDFMERRRAASTRYRTKMRSVHEDLRRRNQELQSENEKLKARVKQLELELLSKPTTNSSQQIQCVPTQLQIPPSTVHLVMNIPKLIIPPTGQPIVTNPITLKVEKK